MMLLKVQKKKVQACNVTFGYVAEYIYVFKN